MRKGISNLVLFAALAWAGAAVASPDEIQWLDNYKDALREAKRTQKPVFLEYRCEA